MFDLVVVIWFALVVICVVFIVFVFAGGCYFRFGRVCLLFPVEFVAVG